MGSALQDQLICAISVSRNPCCCSELSGGQQEPQAHHEKETVSKPHCTLCIERQQTSLMTTCFESCSKTTAHFWLATDCAHITGGTPVRETYSVDRPRGKDSQDLSKPACSQDACARTVCTIRVYQYHDRHWRSQLGMIASCVDLMYDLQPRNLPAKSTYM